LWGETPSEDTQAPDTPTPDTTRDVPTEDVAEEDIPFSDNPVDYVPTDVPEKDVPEKDVTADVGPNDTVTIEGTVWRYYCMFCDAPGEPGGGTYYMEPAGGVEVVTEGLEKPVSTNTSNDQCDTWWMPDSESTCGRFEIQVPAGASLYLRAVGGESEYPGQGYLDGLGPVFTADEDTFQLLILAQEHLVEYVQESWKITPDPDKGLVAGITAVLDPMAATLFTELIGGVQVTMDPTVDDPDYQFVYFDSKDMTNTERKDTDEAQPLFFASNVPPDQYKASATHDTFNFEDLTFVVEAGAMTYLPFSPVEGPEMVEVWGRVWNYYVSGNTLEYDYPWNEVSVAALGAGDQQLGETVTDVYSCSPWDPSDPYMCGTFSLPLAQGLEVMLKASNNSGYMDTMTGIFAVDHGDVQVIVMIQEPVVGLLSSMWGSILDPDKGHVVGIVATTSNDIGAPPFESFIGAATVEITPSDGFGEDFLMAYYDADDPSNLKADSTDPALPLFVAINLPPRGFDDPYDLMTAHDTHQFAPVSFAIQPGVLTYLIVSPKN